MNVFSGICQHCHSRCLLCFAAGAAPHGGLPAAGAAEGLGVGLHLGGAGEEDEGHLPHPQPVQLRRHQQVSDRRGVVSRQRPGKPARGAGGGLGA